MSPSDVWSSIWDDVTGTQQPLDDRGVVLTEAVAHKRPGGSSAWDIHRTTYAVEDGEVTAGATEEIADDVHPAQLEAKYPELVDYSAFKSCRTAG